MTKDDIYSKLKDALVSEFDLNEADIKLEALLFEDLDLDSIDAVDLIVKMKPYIKGHLDTDMFKSVRTVQDVIDVLYPLVQD